MFRRKEAWRSVIVPYSEGQVVDVLLNLSFQKFKIRSQESIYRRLINIGNISVKVKPLRRSQSRLAITHRVPQGEIFNPIYYNRYDKHAAELLTIIMKRLYEENNIYK